MYGYGKYTWRPSRRNLHIIVSNLATLSAVLLHLAITWSESPLLLFTVSCSLLLPTRRTSQATHAHLPQSLTFMRARPAPRLGRPISAQAHRLPRPTLCLRRQSNIKMSAGAPLPDIVRELVQSFLPLRKCFSQPKYCLRQRGCSNIILTRMTCCTRSRDLRKKETHRSLLTGKNRSS